MRLIARTTCFALMLTGAAALGSGEAAAQLSFHIPSRVGGTIATRGSTGALIMANRRLDNRVGFADRTGFAGVGWPKWDLWTLNVGQPPDASVISIVTAPVVLVRNDSRVLVLGRAQDNRLYIAEESSGGSKFFNAWARMPLTTNTGGTVPTFTARPAMVRRTDGLLAVYALDGSGNVWEAIQSGSSWGTWRSLGRPSGVTLRNSPVLSLMNNGAYLLFAAGTNNRLYAAMQSGGNWGGWTDLGGAVGPNDAIASAPNSNGRVSVFVNNTSSTISLRTQTAVDTNSWTAWTTLSGTVTGQSRPAVAVQGDRRIAVFFYSPNGSHLNWRVQTGPSSTTWSNWTNIQSGGATSAPATLTDANGVIHLVLMGQNGMYYERAQVSANSTSWSQLQAGYLGGPYSAP